MSATEVLRRMLDERGVEWETDRSGFRVMWGKPVDEFHDTMQFKAVDNALPNGGLNVHICGFTPEQAIAATQGESPRLPHFWTHDGTLHIEATRMPTRIVVCEGGTCEFVPKRELYVSEAENAKLRELVRILKNCADECGDCDTCPINDGSGVLNPWLGCDSLRDRMRELGVGVD